MYLSPVYPSDRVVPRPYTSVLNNGLTAPCEHDSTSTKNQHSKHNQADVADRGDALRYGTSDLHNPNDFVLRRKHCNCIRRLFHPCLRRVAT